MFKHIDQNTPKLPTEETLTTWSSKNKNSTQIKKETYNAAVNFDFFGMFGGDQEEEEEEEESVIGQEENQADVPMQSSSSGNFTSVTAEEGYPDGSGKGSVTLAHIEEDHMEEEGQEQQDNVTLASLIWI